LSLPDFKAHPLYREILFATLKNKKKVDDSLYVDNTYSMFEVEESLNERSLFCFFKKSVSSDTISKEITDY
jgi:hypothetical protein